MDLENSMFDLENSMLSEKKKKKQTLGERDHIVWFQYMESHMILLMEVSRTSKTKAIKTGIRLVVSRDRSEERMEYIHC